MEYKPVQKKNSSWTPTTVQKKGKSPGKLGHFSVQPKLHHTSAPSQEIGEYKRASGDRLAANVMRGIQAKEQEQAEGSTLRLRSGSTVQRKSESPWAPGFDAVTPIAQSPASQLKGAFAPVSENPIQRQCADCAKEEEQQATEAGKDLEEIGIQTKLTVGAPGDTYEQEADRVASQVMSMSAPPDSSASVQRQLETNNPKQIWQRAQSIKPVVQTRIDPRVQMGQMVQRAAQIEGNQASGDLESRLNASKGGGSPLSEGVRGFMEPRFGADFSGVRVHTGGEAVQMNQELGAQAFTHGSDVYFGDGKSPGNNELTAHELTHVVQQTGGVTTKLQRRPLTSYVTPLLQRQNTVQLRRASNDPDARFARATSSESGLTVFIDAQELYAEHSLVTIANAALVNVGKHGSFIQLDDSSGQIQHEGNTLNKVTPVWVNKGSNSGQHAGLNAPNAGGADSEGNVGGSMALWTDCGRSSEAVTGSQGGDRQAVYYKNGSEKTTYGRSDSNMHNVTKNPAGKMANQIFFDLMYSFINDPNNAAYLQPGHKERVFDFWESLTSFSYKTKEQKKKPKDGVKAQQLYDLLTDDGKRAFDKAAGINDYANPGIGEAYTMSSGYNFPGFQGIPGNTTWNFHWAGVIMKDASDNITLENYAVTREYAQSVGVPQRDFVDRGWNFAMYGSVKSDGTVDNNETFHHDHLASDTHGNKATTMAVRTDQ